MWDTLHFLLTGVSADHLENNLRSNMVVGHAVIDEENLLAYTSSAKVKEITEEIAGINFTDILAGFNMQKCKAAKLYPDIWDDEEDKEDTWETLPTALSNSSSCTNAPPSIITASSSGLTKCISNSTSFAHHYLLNRIICASHEEIVMRLRR